MVTTPSVMDVQSNSGGRHDDRASRVRGPRRNRVQPRAAERRNHARNRLLRLIRALHLTLPVV